ncbi:MAG: D-alanine--D-alanine ligase [Alphaproteobacteria bacterium]
MKKVVVIYGGISNEKEVSKATGKEAIKALQSLKRYNVIGYELTDDIADFVQFLKNEAPNVIFNALHGTYGEDGNIQGLLNLMHIPYTHSGVKASSIAMDKVLTNRIYASAGLPVAENMVMFGKQAAKLFPLDKDVVVKPVADGSSVGVYIIKAGDKLPHNEFNQWDDTLMMVEDFIAGRELTISVNNGKAVCVTEIVTSHDFYDYSAKYESGGSRHILPAKLTTAEEKEVKDLAEQAFDILECRGIARADFRYNGKEFYILEMNTQPGMTSTSLMPEQMAYLGVSYPELCAQMVEEAKTDFGK